MIFKKGSIIDTVNEANIIPTFEKHLIELENNESDLSNQAQHINS